MRTELNRNEIVKAFHVLGNRLMYRVNANSLGILTTEPMPKTLEKFHSRAMQAMEGIKHEAVLWERLPILEKAKWYRWEMMNKTRSAIGRPHTQDILLDFGMLDGVSQIKHALNGKALL